MKYVLNGVEVECDIAELTTENGPRIITAALGVHAAIAHLPLREARLVMTVALALAYDDKKEAEKKEAEKNGPH